jgi:hypothetical protein
MNIFSFTRGFLQEREALPELVYGTRSSTRSLKWENDELVYRQSCRQSRFSQPGSKQIENG